MIQSIRDRFASFLPGRDSLPIITTERVKKVALPIFLLLELFLLFHFPPLGKMFLLTGVLIALTALSEVETLSEPMYKYGELPPLFSKRVPLRIDVKLLNVR